MIIKSKGYMHKLSNETQVAILSVFVLAMLAVFPFQIMIAGIIMGSLLYTAGGSALGGIGIGLAGPVAGYAATAGYTISVAGTSVAVSDILFGAGLALAGTGVGLV
ncbi:hypothetical protein [Sulfuracidifex tepidarius]|uniref:Uncharacterized protein n=1 Tax=Sulfuracidifex tepidarius TaxID=1294262 RepID=A0A510E1Y0_9CREN|nr:hypothetical protein [Sulfuracidifex tepidarius]BBG23716.1 hypothetical protein IC006_1006 [Sulfuracidifex tepidarius]BBG26467.1 hypothetical protein IC007_0977 [Sulfuracidifex tepidarius]